MSGSVRAILIAVVTASIIGVGSFAWARFHSAADAKDVERIERDAKERTKELGKEVDEHISEAQKEWRRQAAFRGAVAAKLRLEIEEVD